LFRLAESQEARLHYVTDNNEGVGVVDFSPCPASLQEEGGPTERLNGIVSTWGKNCPSIVFSAAPLTQRSTAREVKKDKKPVTK